MIVNTVVTGIVCIVIGYLLGAIPSAYVITRAVAGKDIRSIGASHLGRGNVGARNVFVNVGKAAGIGVGAFDVAKGVGAALIARWLLGWSALSQNPLPDAGYFILAAGLAAVVGHIWPVYLGFKGGNGLATSIGVLAVTMYFELLVAIGLLIILVLITRNFVLAANIAVVSTAIWGWFFEQAWWGVLFPVVLVLVMGVHFLPNIKGDMAEAGTKRNLLAKLTRRDKTRGQA